jgi:hypothetical protein
MFIAVKFMIQFYGALKISQYVKLFDTTPDPDQVVIDDLCKALK